MVGFRSFFRHFLRHFSLCTKISFLKRILNSLTHFSRLIFSEPYSRQNHCCHYSAGHHKPKLTMHKVNNSHSPYPCFLSEDSSFSSCSRLAFAFGAERLTKQVGRCLPIYAASFTLNRLSALRNWLDESCSF